MRNQKLFVGSALFFSGWLYACQQDVKSNQLVCTTEFRSVGLTVVGDSLTDFYTIRLTTSDTIRLTTGLEARSHMYLVIDDSYQSKLANRQESFRFIGLINKTIVVNETYSIQADNCHINKVSGKSEVKL